MEQVPRFLGGAICAGFKNNGCVIWNADTNEGRQYLRPTFDWAVACRAVAAALGLNDSNQQAPGVTGIIHLLKQTLAYCKSQYGFILVLQCDPGCGQSDIVQKTAELLHCVDLLVGPQLQRRIAMAATPEALLEDISSMPNVLQTLGSEALRERGGPNQHLPASLPPGALNAFLTRRITATPLVVVPTLDALRPLSGRVSSHLVECDLTRSAATVALSGGRPAGGLHGRVVYSDVVEPDQPGWRGHGSFGSAAADAAAVRSAADMVRPPDSQLWALVMKEIKVMALMTLPPARSGTGSAFRLFSTLDLSSLQPGLAVSAVRLRSGSSAGPPEVGPAAEPRPSGKNYTSVRSLAVMYFASDEDLAVMLSRGAGSAPTVRSATFKGLSYAVATGSRAAPQGVLDALNSAADAYERAFPETAQDLWQEVCNAGGTVLTYHDPTLEAAGPPTAPKPAALGARSSSPAAAAQPHMLENVTELKSSSASVSGPSPRLESRAGGRWPDAAQSDAGQPAAGSDVPQPRPGSATGLTAAPASAVGVSGDSETGPAGRTQPGLLATRDAPPDWMLSDSEPSDSDMGAAATVAIGRDSTGPGRSTGGSAPHTEPAAQQQRGSDGMGAGLGGWPGSGVISTYGSDVDLPGLGRGVGADLSKAAAFVAPQAKGGRGVSGSGMHGGDAAPAEAGLGTKPAAGRSSMPGASANVVPQQAVDEQGRAERPRRASIPLLSLLQPLVPATDERAGGFAPPVALRSAETPERHNVQGAATASAPASPPAAVAVRSSSGQVAVVVPGVQLLWPRPFDLNVAGGDAEGMGQSVTMHWGPGAAISDPPLQPSIQPRLGHSEGGVGASSAVLSPLGALHEQSSSRRPVDRSATDIADPVAPGTASVAPSRLLYDAAQPRRLPSAEGLRAEASLTLLPGKSLHSPSGGLGHSGAPAVLQQGGRPNLPVQSGANVGLEGRGVTGADANEARAGQGSSSAGASAGRRDSGGYRGRASAGASSVGRSITAPDAQASATVGTLSSALEPNAAVAAAVARTFQGAPAPPGASHMAATFIGVHGDREAAAGDKLPAPSPVGAGGQQPPLTSASASGGTDMLIGAYPDDRRSSVGGSRLPRELDSYLKPIGAPPEQHRQAGHTSESLPMAVGSSSLQRVPEIPASSTLQGDASAFPAPASSAAHVVGLPAAHGPDASGGYFAGSIQPVHGVTAYALIHAGPSADVSSTAAKGPASSTLASTAERDAWVQPLQAAAAAPDSTATPDGVEPGETEAKGRRRSRDRASRGGRRSRSPSRSSTSSCTSEEQRSRHSRVRRRSSRRHRRSHSRHRRHPIRNRDASSPHGRKGRSVSRRRRHSERDGSRRRSRRRGSARHSSDRDGRSDDDTGASDVSRSSSSSPPAKTRRRRKSSRHPRQPASGHSAPRDPGGMQAFWPWPLPPYAPFPYNDHQTYLAATGQSVTEPWAQAARVRAEVPPFAAPWQHRPPPAASSLTAAIASAVFARSPPAQTSNVAPVTASPALAAAQGPEPLPTQAANAATPDAGVPCASHPAITAAAVAPAATAGSLQPRPPLAPQPPALPPYRGLPLLPPELSGVAPLAAYRLGIREAAQVVAEAVSAARQRPRPRPPQPRERPAEPDRVSAELAETQAATAAGAPRVGADSAPALATKAAEGLGWEADSAGLGCVGAAGDSLVREEYEAPAVPGRAAQCEGLTADTGPRRAQGSRPATSDGNGADRPGGTLGGAAPPVLSAMQLPASFGDPGSVAIAVAAAAAAAIMPSYTLSALLSAQQAGIECRPGDGQAGRRGNETPGLAGTGPPVRRVRDASVQAAPGSPEGATADTWDFPARRPGPHVPYGFGSDQSEQHRREPHPPQTLRHCLKRRESHRQQQQQQQQSPLHAGAVDHQAKGGHGDEGLRREPRQHHHMHHPPQPPQRAGPPRHAGQGAAWDPRAPSWQQPQPYEHQQRQWQPQQPYLDASGPPASDVQQPTSHDAPPPLDHPHHAVPQQQAHPALRQQDAPWQLARVAHPHPRYPGAQEPLRPKVQQTEGRLDAYSHLQMPQAPIDPTKPNKASRPLPQEQRPPIAPFMTRHAPLSTRSRPQHAADAAWQPGAGVPSSNAGQVTASGVLAPPHPSKQQQYSQKPHLRTTDPQSLQVRCPTGLVETYKECTPASEEQGQHLRSHTRRDLYGGQGQSLAAGLQAFMRDHTGPVQAAQRARPAGDTTHPPKLPPGLPVPAPAAGAAPASSSVARPAYGLGGVAGEGLRTEAPVRLASVSDAEVHAAQEQGARQQQQLQPQVLARSSSEGALHASSSLRQGCPPAAVRALQSVQAPVPPRDLERQQHEEPRHRAPGMPHCPLPGVVAVAVQPGGDLAAQEGSAGASRVASSGARSGPMHRQGSGCAVPGSSKSGAGQGGTGTLVPWMRTMSNTAADARVHRSSAIGAMPGVRMPAAPAAAARSMGPTAPGRALAAAERVAAAVVMDERHVEAKARTAAPGGGSRALIWPAGVTSDGQGNLEAATALLVGVARRLEALASGQELMCQA